MKDTARVILQLTLQVPHKTAQTIEKRVQVMGDKLSKGKNPSVAINIPYVVAQRASILKSTARRGPNGKNNQPKYYVLNLTVGKTPEKTKAAEIEPEISADTPAQS